MAFIKIPEKKRCCNKVRNWHDNKALTSMDWPWPRALNWRIMNLQSHASILISRSECHFITACCCLGFWLQHSSGASRASGATSRSQDVEIARFQLQSSFTPQYASTCTSSKKDARFFLTSMKVRMQFFPSIWKSANFVLLMMFELTLRSSSSNLNGGNQARLCGPTWTWSTAEGSGYTQAAGVTVLD